MLYNSAERDFKPYSIYPSIYIESLCCCTLVEDLCALDDSDMYSAVCAGDEVLRSLKPCFTAEEPLCAANIAEKLQNEFVISVVDIVTIVVVVEGLQLITNSCWSEILKNADSCCLSLQIRNTVNQYV